MRKSTLNKTPKKLKRGDHVLFIPSTHMACQKYSILVLPHVWGEYLIELRDHANNDGTHPDTPHRVCRDLITSHINTVWWAVHRIATAPDPLAYIRTFERPHNFVKPHGRIKLDDL